MLKGTIQIDVSDSGAELRAAMVIQRLIKLRIKARAVRKRINESMFTKKLDLTHGKYYYIMNATGEQTWDVPRGDFPMALPPTPRREEFAKVKMEQKLALAKAKEKRDFLIAQRREEYKQSQIRDVKKADLDEAKRQDDLWADAVEHGKMSGEVNMSWQKLVNISERVYNFKRTTGRDLIHLRLVGHDMEEVPPKMSTSCQYLISLSLTSNRLIDIDPVAQLTRLTQLVLLRNKIPKLPSTFGNLMNLEILEMASNRLESLPPTFGNLTKLQKLNLECNRLKRIPETMSRMCCKTLNLNSNKLIALPHCIANMPNLLQLSANDNSLKYLPSDIGDSKSLVAIHVCNNRLMELPDGIGKLATLENLWLDFNNITALPMSFHKLQSLKELKMEGNWGMIFPPMDKIIKGPKTVLAWSKKRFSSSLFVRQQSIVLSFQDMLKQTAKHKIGGEEHLGIFNKDIQEGDEMFYTYPEELFWELFLPTLEDIWHDPDVNTSGDIKSFPYNRKETEKVMNSFSDPFGPVVLRKPDGWFRRCVCKKPDGSRNVCIPPKAGWMCERPVIMVKMTITLERELMERQRQQQEKDRIAEASAAAEHSAKGYLETEEGIKLIHAMAEARAHELQHETSDSKFKGSLEIEFRRRRKKLEKNFKKKEKQLQKIRNEMYETHHVAKNSLQEKGASLVGWAAEQNDIAIDKLLDTMSQMPEDEDIVKCQDKYEEDLKKLIADIEKKGTKGSLMSRVVPKQFLEFKQKFSKEHNEKLNELIVDLKRQYTEREAFRAKKKTKQTHEKMRKIMSSWTGLGMRDTFFDWKKIAKGKVKQRRKDARKKAVADRLGYEQEMANMDFAQWNLSKWETHWDEFNDLNYWVHKESGKSTYDEPTTDLYIPKGWVKPDPPATMLDPNTGELLSPRSLRRNELDTPSEASEASEPSDSDDERWDKVRGGGGVDSDDEDDEEKKLEDDAVSGMVDFEGQAELSNVAVTVTTGGRVGFANEDEVQDGDKGEITARPSTSQEMGVLSNKNNNNNNNNNGGEMVLAKAKPSGKNEEVDLAMSRVLNRRRKQVKARMKREGLLGDGGEEESEIHKAMREKEEQDKANNALPSEDEVMIMCGYDPAKGDEYSIKEMDAFAKKAIKMNKTLGRTENGGVGSLEGPDGQHYGRYETDFVTGFFDKRKEKNENKKRAKEERAKKFATVGGALEEGGRPSSPTGLGTVFSRAGGPRPKK